MRFLSLNRGAAHGSLYEARTLYGTVEQGQSVWPEAPRWTLEARKHDQTITVTECGRICFGRRKMNLSGVSAGRAARTRSAGSGSTRNWLSIGLVVLNPERAPDQAVAYQAAA